MPKKGEYEFPLRVITRKGEKYVYVGDVPNTKYARQSVRDFSKSNGRKYVIVVDPYDKRFAIHYASNKFYNWPNVVQYPSYGKGNLLKGG